jgi:hypothetical protein
MANPKMTCRKVSISRIFNLADEDTVDGCEILHELKTVVSPILCRVSTILLVVFVFFSIHNIIEQRMFGCQYLCSTIFAQ